MKKMITAVLTALALLTALVGCGKKDNEYNITNKDYFSDYDTDTIIMDENGDILEISIDDYSDVTFDYSGLSDYIKNEVKAYNDKAGAEKISFVQFDNNDGIVKSAIIYNDFDSYNDFNNMNVTFSLYNEEYCNEIANEEFVKLNAASMSDETEETDEEVSDAELAEAGLTRAEYDDLKREQDKEKEDGKVPEVITATFTDASTNDVVDSSSITDESIMMFTVPGAIDIKLDGGEFLYYNKHAVLDSSGTISTDGEGVAIIVFKMNF